MKKQSILAHACPAAASLLLALALALMPMAASATDTCGPEVHSCPCAAHCPCICCSNGGNCVWWAWHEACCNWGVALEWCTDAGTWDNYAVSYGYPIGTDPGDSSVFVCEPSSICSGWGHVGWVITAHPDGSFDSTEMACGGYYGVRSYTRSAGFAEHYIYDPGGGTPVEIDNAQFVSETIPDGTHFSPGESFTKSWTMRNTGNTTWTRDGNYVWAWDGDEQFSAAAETLLPTGVSVAPSDTYDWEVPMIAPLTNGTFRGYWRMDHVGTDRFGTRVWIEIVVEGEPPPPDIAEPVPEEVFEPVDEIEPLPELPVDGIEPSPEPVPDIEEPVPDIEEPQPEAPDAVVEDVTPPLDGVTDGLTGEQVIGGGCACSLAV